jgi:hypothetical protein
VKNASILVHERVDSRMTGSTVLGLHMENVLADFDIRVKAGTHGVSIPSFIRAESK